MTMPNAGADQTVADDALVTLVGTPPGGAWSQDSGDAVTLSAPVTSDVDTRCTFTANNTSTSVALELVFRYTEPAATDSTTKTTEPPADWETYVEKDVSAGGRFDLDNTVNYKIVNQTAAAPVWIRGGRKVVIMGLTINCDAVANWTTISEVYTTALECQTYPNDGSTTATDAMFHIEGVLAQGANMTQGFRFNAQSHDVQIVNCHVRSMTLFDNCDHRDGTNAKTRNHPDVIQAYNGAFKSLRIDGLTGYSGYQGLFFKIGEGGSTGIYQALSPAGRNVYMRRVDLHATQFTDSRARIMAGHRMFWNHGHDIDTTLRFPVTVENSTVWIEGHPNSGWAGNASFKRVEFFNTTTAAYELEPVLGTGTHLDAVAYGSGSVAPTLGTDTLGDYATMPDTTGKVRLGLRADGEYVPAATVGSGYYTSPSTAIAPVDTTYYTTPNTETTTLVTSIPVPVRSGTEAAKNLVEGHHVVVLLQIKASVDTALTPPAGTWTLLDENLDAELGGVTFLYEHFITATEATTPPAEWVFTLATAREVTALARRSSGVSTVQPQDVAVGVLRGDTGIQQSPGVTTVTKNAYVIHFMTVGSGSRTLIPQAAMAESFNVPNGDRTTGLASPGVVATAGTIVPTLDWRAEDSTGTNSTSLNYVGYTVALRPANP